MEGPFKSTGIVLGMFQGLVIMMVVRWTCSPENGSIDKEGYLGVRQARMQIGVSG